MVPALKQMYDDLGYISKEDFKPISEQPFSDGSWLEFDQTEFIKQEGHTELKGALGLMETQFYETGRVFVPHKCKTETCRVHVALHGCFSNADEFSWYSEYNPLAATNNIIVLYPNSLCQNMVSDSAVIK